jgi:hypothetical protein
VLLMFIHLPPPERRRLLRAAATTLAPGGIVLVAGYHTDQAQREGGFRDPALLFTAEDIAADLDGLRIERAERLEVGDDVDSIVRAVKD